MKTQFANAAKENRQDIHSAGTLTIHHYHLKTHLATSFPTSVVMLYRRAAIKGDVSQTESEKSSTQLLWHKAPHFSSLSQCFLYVLHNILEV